MFLILPIRTSPFLQVDCERWTGDGPVTVRTWSFIPPYFITSWLKGNSYFVFDRWHLVCCLLKLCVWLTLLVKSISNSVLYPLEELSPSSVITPFLPLLWLCTLRCCSVFLTLNFCQPVIITVRYRMSFSSTLCTVHMQLHTQCEIEMRHRCQLGEMAAISLITLLSETQSLSTASISPSSLSGVLSFWKLICCVDVPSPLFLRGKKSDVWTQRCFVTSEREEMTDCGAHLLRWSTEWRWFFSLWVHLMPVISQETSSLACQVLRLVPGTSRVYQDLDNYWSSFQ